MCLDSLEYRGLVKLYTDYNALKQIHDDLSLRFDLIDKDYLLCKDALTTSNKSLVIVNQSRDSLILQNQEYYNKFIDTERKFKNWRLFGITTSISFVSIITILILTN